MASGRKTNTTNPNTIQVRTENQGKSFILAHAVPKMKTETIAPNTKMKAPKIRKPPRLANISFTFIT